MTKEQKIQEAWGEYYKQIKNELDKHGRYSYSDQNTSERKRKMWQFENIECHQINDMELIIPSSIKGIETNNGWIKIKSEYDAPDEDVWVCNINGNRSAFIHDAGELFGPNSTHYQPVQKPKPPIY
ncbi:hypothetical protein [Chryseobacterium sp. JK1]|uniref:hypothetical protein n=1 Tax=Chryseobacterium sp. JK1 TaxID=874294 RepID=UPI003D686A4E